MTIKKLSLSILIVTIAAMIFPATAFAAESTKGCPGGPAGDAIAGSICTENGGYVLSLDPSLSAYCPGAADQSLVVADSYAANCPARPGRAACAYVYAQDVCIGGNKKDIYQGDAHPGAPHTSGRSAVNNDPNDDGSTLLKTNESQKIYDRITQAINFLSAMVGVAVVISVVLGGIQYTTSGGDPQKVSAAKKRLTNAFVALFIFFFIYAFLQYLIPGGVFGT